ncbi:MAG: sulfotransferase [Pseudomonadota bacterium]
MDHLFVITYGRSGSTLLLNILNAIEGYCIRGENDGATQRMVEAVEHMRATKERFAHKDDGTPQSPWYGVKDIECEEWGKAVATAFTRHILRPEGDTRVTGFKEIRFTPRHQSDEMFLATLDFLTSAFPNARVIFNTRSVAEIAQSGWWSRRDPKQVQKTIEASNARFRQGKTILGDRAFLIDYAQYNANPEGFQPLLDWLGESVPPERLAEVSAIRLDHGREQELKRKPGLKTRLKRMLRA